MKVDPSRSFTERRRLSYDARNKRERRVETVEKDSNRTFYDELILWNEVYNMVIFFVCCFARKYFAYTEKSHCGKGLQD